MKDQQQRNAARAAVRTLAYTRIAFDDNTIVGQRAAFGQAVEKMLHLVLQLL